MGMKTATAERAPNIHTETINPDLAGGRGFLMLEEQRDAPLYNSW
jgi:hypothetical protein